MTDRGFRIKSMRAARIDPGGRGYWEGFTGEGAEGRFFFRDGWRTAYPRRVETAIVKVELDDGTIGWGEANAPIAPEVTVLLANGLLAAILEGRGFESPEAMWDLLYDANRGRGHHGSFYLDAAAMIDIAVWDAIAKRAGRPLAAMLAPEPRRHIACYLSGLRQGSRAERVLAAKGWADRGLEAVKLFMDGDTEAGVGEIGALQSALPEMRRWMVDVLWSFTEIEPAAAAKRAYGDLGCGWLECPMLPEDLDGHRALCAKPGAPIALGEHVHTRFESERWLRGRAVDIFQPDVGRTGVSEMRRLLAIAREAGVKVTPHMGSGLDIFQAATLQIAAVTDADLDCEFQAGIAGRLGEAIDTGWRFRDGGFTLPDRPGIGVEVDEAALQRFVVPA